MTNGAMHGLHPRHLKTSWWRSGLLSRAEPRRPRRPGQPRCHRAGPGLGFGKMWTKTGFFARCSELNTGGRRWLVGASRKSFIGAVTGVREPRERVPGSLVAAVLAMQGGAEFSGSTTSPPMCKLSTLSWRQGMPDSKLGSRIRPSPTSFSPPKTETTMSELQSIDASNFDSLTASGVV